MTEPEAGSAGPGEGVTLAKPSAGHGEGLTPAKRHPRWTDILATAAVSAATAPPQTFFYGGQAVIEGVLMRGKHHYAVAARKPDGTIAVTQERLQSRVYTSKFWKQPFLRGVAGLIEMLHLGMRALSWSANLQLGEDVELSPRAMRYTVATSVVFALVLFIGLPAVAGQVIHHGDRGTGIVLVEGGARAVLLVGYLFLISLIPSVRRVYEYHGAEHKTINCFEHGGPMDEAHVRASSRLHPRCGTGFIVVVAFVSIIVFAPLGGLFLPLRVGLQILLVPVVAAVSYEAIRALAKVRDTLGGRIALVPILATQRLTTRVPDGPQIEVALTAFAAARAGDLDGVHELGDPLIP